MTLQKFIEQTLGDVIEGARAGGAARPTEFELEVRIADCNNSVVVAYTGCMDSGKLRMLVKIPE